MKCKKCGYDSTDVYLGEGKNECHHCNLLKNGVPMVVEEVLVKEVKSIGNSAHIVVPKRYENRTAYVMILDVLIRPRIHKNKTKMHNGKTYVFAEITTGAGVHSLWLPKDKVKKIFTA
ncbi:MAG: DUF2080 family transposase-associated protein [archaeon]